MAKGRDEEFTDRLRSAAGAVDLSAVAQGPPDPRQFPFTLTEVTFRQTYHEWTMIRDSSGKVLAFQMDIIDPADRHVYHYSFNEKVLDDMLETLTKMKADAQVPLEPEVLQ